MASFVVNLLRGAQKRIQKTFHNPYKQFGITKAGITALKHLPKKDIYHWNFLSKQIAFYDKEEFIHSLKEIFADEIYKIQLPDNALIIDCGANMGMSVIYFKRLNPNVRIIAYEPDEKNFLLLAENVKSFDLKNIELKKEAVWIEDTFISFSNEGTMSSKIVDKPETASSTKIKAARLKDSISEKTVLLKLDIEGAEYSVIKDIQEKLFLIENIFLEYHGTFEQNNQLAEILTILTNNNFKYYIKEADNVYSHPFFDHKRHGNYDVQLNIFCFKK